MMSWFASRLGGRPNGPSLGLGVYTRFMVRHYLWFILVTLLSISSAVTAINVSGDISRVWSEQSVDGTLNAVLMTGYFVVLRLMDNSAQALPISVILALVWAETSHAAGGRLVMVRTVGMGYWVRARGLLVTAMLIVAPAQFSFDNFIRPHAMLELKRNGLGEYGWRHQSDQTPRMHWFSKDGNVIQAVFTGVPETDITDVSVYEISPQGSLLSIIRADRLAPVSGKASQWKLERAQSWRLGDGTGAIEVANKVTSLSTLSLSETWLRYRGLDPKYVPLADLVRLFRDQALPDDHPAYAEWLALRLVQWVNTVLILLCVAAVFALVLDRRGLIVAGLSGLFAGYLLYLFSRVSIVLVESRGFNSVVSAGVLPLLLAAVLILASRELNRRDQAVAV